MSEKRPHDDSNGSSQAPAKRAHTDVEYAAARAEEAKVMRHVVINEYKGPKEKPVRVWCDGCFDIMHWGHANALRQAKACGDILVVGVHSDKEILRNKGPPVMQESERYAAVAACKWVDEIVEDAPYRTYLETLELYNIDFCVHGEDLSVDEFGRDTYAECKAAGKYRQIKRAEGVSTTEIVGRMILMTRDHLSHTDSAIDAVDHKTMKEMQQRPPSSPPVKALTSPGSPMKPITVSPSPPPQAEQVSISHFLPTTRSIVLFSEGSRSHLLNSSIDGKPPVVVYIDGAFDLFHVGHIEALHSAKLLGDYLIVGVHDDKVVNQIKGGNLPILNLHERVLSVLACRYVDEVVIGAPWSPTRQQLQQLGVTVFARGTCSDYLNKPGTGQAEPNAAAKELGIYREFESKNSELTTTSIIRRILHNRMMYEERNAKKAKGLQEIRENQASEYGKKLETVKHS